MLVPEGRRLFQTLTVLENLRLGAYLPRARATYDESLERVFGLFPVLQERANGKAGLLSGGEQQMLAIGRAVMAHPKLVMIDEASLGLSPILTRTIFDLIVALNQQGTTVLLVEQNIHMALKICHKAYVMKTGQRHHERDRGRAAFECRCTKGLRGRAGEQAVMTSLMQVVINGILLGSMYGIAAAGLSLIFGTMRIIFLAQGTMIVFFAFVVYWLFVKLSLDPYLCLLIVVPFAFLVGLGMFYTLFRKAAALEDKNVSLLIAVGLMYLIENAILKVWSASPRGLNISYSSATLVAWGLRISWLRLVLLGLALLSALVVFLFLKKTRLGTAVRAASEDMEATTLQGINSGWVCAISFAVGIGLGGSGRCRDGHGVLV